MSNLGKQASLSSRGGFSPLEGRGRIGDNPAFFVHQHGFISGFEVFMGFHLVFKSSCGCSSPVQAEGAPCCLLRGFWFFVLDMLWDVGAHWVHTSRQGTRVAQEALPLALAQAVPPAMGISCWQALLGNIGVQGLCLWEVKAHLGSGQRLFLCIEVEVSAAFCFSEHSTSRSVRKSSLCAEELSHCLGEAAEAQPLPFCQVFRPWPDESGRSPWWA